MVLKPKKHPSTKTATNKATVYVLAMLAWSVQAIPAHAEDLITIYRQALIQDPVLEAAKFALEAAHQKIPQASAGAAVIMAAHATPAMLGGTIRPLWEAPLPQWWPASLVGVLSIIETKGNGEYSQAGNAHMLEPYGANMIVHAPDLLAAGGFVETIGRVGKALLSDEEKVLASRLREAGHSVRYDSRIIAYHQIQADRLTIGWLLSRMYWQGMSRVRSAGQITPNTSLLGETMRRVLVFLLLSPVAMLPTRSTWWIDLRWRWYYSYGFLRALLTAAPESRDGRLSRRPSVSEIPRNMVPIGGPVQRS